MIEYTITLTATKDVTVATISITNSHLSIAAGKWPVLMFDPDTGMLKSQFVDVPSTEIDLNDSITHIYLSYPDGSGQVYIDLASDMVEYGFGAVAENAKHPEADLLAWKGDDEWHVKRLQVKVLESEPVLLPEEDSNAKDSA